MGDKKVLHITELASSMRTEHRTIYSFKRQNTRTLSNQMNGKVRLSTEEEEELTA
jgi:hypothetical protein